MRVSSEQGKSAKSRARYSWVRTQTGLHRVGHSSPASPYFPERQRSLRRGLKQRVLDLYGGKCVCCNEARFEFLTIDHKDGEGAKERRSRHRGGGSSTAQFYWKLLRQGAPLPNIRLLCFNCNCSHGCYGYCPHSSPEKAWTAKK
jgi:hypothetical protein